MSAESPTRLRNILSRKPRTDADVVDDLEAVRAIEARPDRHHEEGVIRFNASRSLTLIARICFSDNPAIAILGRSWSFLGFSSRFGLRHIARLVALSAFLCWMASIT